MLIDVECLKCSIFKVLYLSTADGEMWFLRRLFFCFRVEFESHVRAGFAQVRYYWFCKGIKV